MYARSSFTYPLQVVCGGGSYLVMVHCKCICCSLFLRGSGMKGEVFLWREDGKADE